MSDDHVVPLSVAPQLDKVISNLELMPLRMNQNKRDTTGERQVVLLQKMQLSGFLK
jgi:hypothetical protein